MNPETVRLPFNPNTIKEIKGGGGHVMVLNIYGQVYTCGWNNRGQLGLNLEESHNSEFTYIPQELFDSSTTTVTKIACGWDISGAITSTGKLYVWGANNYQQLGLCLKGFNSIRRPLQLQLPRDEIVKDVSFGLRHCAVLTEDNNIYIFGRLRLSEPHPHGIRVSLMVYNKTDIIKIQTDFPIGSVISGQNHCLLLTEDRRRIIGLGDNKFGQANQFDFTDEVKEVKAGWTHNAILSVTKEVYLWGRNTYGQIGVDTLQEAFRIPTKLPLPKECVPTEIHLGSEHGMLLTQNGEVMTWGWNEHGNCGNGNVSNV